MSPVLIAADLIAIAVLIFVLFVPRHGRRDLVVAYLGVNVGVLAVATALSSTTVAAGLGLGLFGVLSIIRLRSEELTQKEIAYYFGALALGLIGGLGSANLPVTIGLMAMVVLAIGLGDLFSPRSEQQLIILDRAHAELAAARGHVERVLGIEVSDVTIIKTDLVNDTTSVRVRYAAGAGSAARLDGATSQRVEVAR